MNNKAQNEAEQLRLQYMIGAAATGHNLGMWQFFADASLRNGYEATCTNCGMSVAVWESGAVYSLLDDKCQASAG